MQEIKKPKRDFLFIDESGDPGTSTDYFIMGLIHITDLSFKKLNIHLGAFRYFGEIKNELKSTRLNKIQKEKLLDILNFSIDKNNFVTASAVYVNKNDYQGNYLKENEKYSIDSTKFRHFMMRRLLEFHFENNEAQSNEIELIIDRFHSTENKEQQMRNYLRNETFYNMPKFLHITQADSRYVELLQIADWISGSVKEKFFVRPEENYDNLFSHIKTKKIIT
ncbi:MAG: DUF3800 domain-containing protein [Candidatus Pacebacteria bacterium]|nr:DUF3800 domain-containing protein [Candidatus Paceibacterota bacterium]